MPNDSYKYVPFSQREGYEPIAPQLALGDVSEELRRLLDYYVSLEVDRNSRHGPGGRYLDGPWKRVALDFYVKFNGIRESQVPDDLYEIRGAFSSVFWKAKIGSLFNAVEFLARHPLVSAELKRDLGEAFRESRAAYRVVDQGLVIAIGTEEVGEAVERSLNDADKSGAAGARDHLIEAGTHLRDGDWPGSVRESIHAVESVAVRLAPGTSKLGDALKAIEKQGHLHGQLKAAFEKLYAYTNAEKGVRHANVFEGVEAQVDEADALFMLGACASFVSYLLARGGGAA